MLVHVGSYDDCTYSAGGDADDIGYTVVYVLYAVVQARNEVGEGEGNA